MADTLRRPICERRVEALSRSIWTAERGFCFPLERGRAVPGSESSEPAGCIPKWFGAPFNAANRDAIGVWLAIAADGSR